MKKFFLFLMSFILLSCNGQETKTQPIKPKKMENKNLEYATIAGGCFWCVEACFDMMKGVESVTSGYSGGHKDNPAYEEVCTGETGHAEVVQIAFDPKVISFSQILEAFWFLHAAYSHNGIVLVKTTLPFFENDAVPMLSLLDKPSK